MLHLIFVCFDFFYFFFFSSRRRHTRSLCDWSSDVCSSDLKQTIRLVNEEMMRIQTALRHIDIHNCWVRQEAKKGSFEVKYLPTNKMPADGLTKALDRGKFGRFVAQLGLTPLPEIETA